MFNVGTITFIQQFIAGFIAYLITAGLVGCFQAWVCTLVGDDTPEKEGYLTVNPLMHADVFGVICLLLIGVGFNPSMPINPFNMPYRGRTIRYVIALFSNVFISIILSALWIVLLVVFSIEAGQESTSSVFSFFQVNSFFDALMLVGRMLLNTSLFFAVLNLVYDSFLLLAYGIRDKITEQEREIIGWVFLIMPIAILYFYGPYLSFFIQTIVIGLVSFFQGIL